MIATKLIELLADGGKLNVITRRKDMPSNFTLAKWRKERPDFADAFVAAMAARCELWLDETREDLEDDSRDFVQDEKGRPVPNRGGTIRRIALRNDAMERASRLVPYLNPKVTIEATVTQQKRLITVDPEEWKELCESNRRIELPIESFTANA